MPAMPARWRRAGRGRAPTWTDTSIPAVPATRRVPAGPRPRGAHILGNVVTAVGPVGPVGRPAHRAIPWGSSLRNAATRWPVRPDPDKDGVALSMTHPGVSTFPTHPMPNTREILPFNRRRRRRPGGMTRGGAERAEHSCSRRGPRAGEPGPTGQRKFARPVTPRDAPRPPALCEARRLDIESRRQAVWPTRAWSSAGRTGVRRGCHPPGPLRLLRSPSRCGGQRMRAPRPPPRL